MAGDPARQVTIQARRALTLFEMMVTIGIVAIAAALITPGLGDDNRLRLVAASNVLSSDIELAQVMTIAYPDQPVLVKFDPDNQKYWLAYEWDPDTPIARDDSGALYEVVFGAGRASTASEVTLLLDSVTDNVIAFNAQGGLTDFSLTPRIQLNRQGSAVTLSVAPTTGTIRESQGTIADAKAAM